MISQLSIIVPTLNEEQYLPRLLESIAEQDFQGELEVIIVDCGSSDRTVERALQYRSRLPALRVLKTCKDVGHRRNAGAKAALYECLM